MMKVEIEVALGRVNTPEHVAYVESLDAGLRSGELFFSKENGVILDLRSCNTSYEPGRFVSVYRGYAYPKD